MILSGPEIKKYIEMTEPEFTESNGVRGIHIDDFNDVRLNPNSYNLRLGKLVKSVRPRGLPGKHTNDGAFDTRNPIETTEIVEFQLSEQGAILKPGELWLGTTVERTETHGFVPAVEGRSSLGRLGLFVHVTAGFGDDGFCGHWTLEMTSLFPVRLYPGMEICQIYYHALQGLRKPYRGRYQNQVQPQESAGV